MSDKQSETGTQAIQRALAILNCFTRGIDDLSLTEISKLVQIPYSTASRIAGILEQESFLIRDKNTKRFSLGRRVYSLGYCAKQNDFLRKVIYPYLVRLRDEFGETALIYIREGDYRICFERCRPSTASSSLPPSAQNMCCGQELEAGAFLRTRCRRSRTIS